MTAYLTLAVTAACVAMLTTRTAPLVAGTAGAAPTPGGTMRLLLVAALLVPCVYFGAQLLAAPYFPHYSVLTTTASELGSDRSSRPAILNTGAVLTGLLAFAGSAGLAMALPRAGASRLAAFALAFCLASAGLAACWAGWHPLPSPRHDPGVLAIGMFIAPPVAVWATWRLRSHRALRAVLTLNALAFLVLVAAAFGMAGLHPLPYGGLAQKLLAALSFAPGTLIAGTLLLTR
jgi:hypothetical membrane protein